MDIKQLRKWLNVVIGLYIQRDNFTKEQYEERLNYLCNEILKELHTKSTC